ncbi:hypothetical protein JQM83_09060 [Parabacteroides distasonis]|nr:hypothetical protein [Parabacteroides distasonis]
MKQRLLLALLVLFASVGSTWADTKLTIPVNTGKVTVTVKLADNQTMPVATNDFTVSGNTITILNNAGTEAKAISFSAGLFSEITVSGGTVKQFEVSTTDATLTKLTLNSIGLETLTVTNASNLATLSCNNNKLKEELDLSSLSALTSLDCSVNQLTNLKVSSTPQFTTLNCSSNHLQTVPTATMATNYKMTFGTQTIDLTEDVTTIANVWKNVISSVKSEIGTPFPNDATGTNTTYKFSSSDAHENPVSPGEYKFYNSSAYVSGDYVLMIQNTDTQYSGYTYEVKIRVTPAQFAYSFTNDGGKNLSGGTKGTMTVYIKQANGTFVNLYESVASATTSVEASASSLRATTSSAPQYIHEGDVLRFSVDPQDNYTFKEFTYSGLTPNSGFSKTSNPAEFTVKGGIKDDVKITANATYNTDTYKINYNPVDPAAAGSFTIVKSDGSVVTDGSSVAYNTTLEIKPTANPNYTVDKVTINGVLLPDDGSGKYITMIKEDWNVTVYFKTSVNFEFSMIRPAGLDVFVDGVNRYSDLSTVDTKKVLSDIQPSKKLEIRLGLDPAYKDTHIIEDILINSKSYKEVSEASLKEIDLNTSVLTYTTPANGKVLIEPKLKELETIGISITSVPANQGLVYDNTVKKIAYTTTPVQLSDVTLTYSDDEGTTFTATPKNARTYHVKYARAKDKTYKALSITSSYPTVTIAAAPVALSNVSGSINIASNGVQTYKISGSARATNTNATVQGKFVLTDNAGETDQAAREDMSVPADKQGTNHSINVTFIPTDNTNYATATTSVDIKGDKNNDFTKYTIKAGQLPEGVTATIKNGDVVLQNGASVVKNTVLTLLFTTPEGVTVKNVYNDDASSTSLISDYDITTNNTYTITRNVIFKVETDGTAAPTKDYKITAEATEVSYDGTVQSYDSDNLTVKSYNGAADIKNNTTITYAYSQNGTKIDSPVNAGEYDVTITVAKETIGSGTSAVIYKEATVKTKLIIKKANLTIDESKVQMPTGSDLGKGAALGSSVLSDGAVPGIAGTFEWKDPTYVPTSSEISSGEYEGEVIFKPASDNYNTYTFMTKTVKVKVANKYTLTIITPTHGKLSVTSGNKTLNNGDEVPNGTLTFTATPDQGYKLESIKVNGTAITGTTYTANNTSVKVEATFVEITEFTVSVSTSVKGIELVLPSSNVVKKGASYSFSVKGLAADLANLVVSDGTNIYTGTNGAYTIINITANKTITVTMKAGTAPTQVEAVIEANLSTQGKSMGTVTVTKISSLRADAVDSSTQKFYYGDKIRVTATPAAGCRFVGWEGRTETSSVIDVLITETSYKFKAIFAGSPTGAEVIEGVDIYGSNGEIVVKCDGAARITIVSMNGQSKQQEISGDTRIPAGAGIYGIVFEQGNNVMRTKVAVK